MFQLKVFNFKHLLIILSSHCYNGDFVGLTGFLEEATTCILEEMGTTILSVRCFKEEKKNLTLGRTQTNKENFKISS